MGDKEYIERGSALFELETGWFPQSMEYTEAVEIARNLIKALPAVNVAEVRRGVWGRGFGTKELVCSKCGSKRPLKRKTAEGAKYGVVWNSPYCPNCGAKMDGNGDSNDEVR